MRYNPDDDEMTLGELLRQERFGAGISDQKSLDAQYAKALIGDGKFEVRGCLLFNLPLTAHCIFRMTLITLMTMLNASQGKKCALMP